MLNRNYQTYKKGAFNRFWLAWYERWYVWLFFASIPLIFLTLILHVLKVFSLDYPYWLAISQKIYAWSLFAILLLKFGLFLRELAKYKGYYLKAKKLERLIKKSLIDTASLNNPKYLNKIYVPTVRVDLSQANGSAARRARVEVSRLSGMNNVLDSLINDISAVFRGGGLNGFAVVDFLEYQDRSKFEFTLEDVTTSHRLKPTDFKELINQDPYLLTIMDNLKWDMNKQPGLLLSAKTGAGKTFFISGLIFQYLAHFNEEDRKNNTGLYIFDRKKVLSALTFFKDRIYTEKDDFLIKLRELVANMEEREREVTKGIEKAGRMDFTAKDLGLKPVIILVEELGATMADLDTKERKEADALLSQIAMKGRAVGYGLVFVSQNMGAEIVKVAIRNQFSFRILLGKGSREDLGFIFGSNIDTITENVPKFTGYYLLDGITNTPQRIEPADITAIYNTDTFKKAYDYEIK